ncbi:MAG: hypothetical protein PHU66_09930 [Bacteroidaceae bacterium]|nr:hypothetical protein [Bacteroidaceae bacterium]
MTQCVSFVTRRVSFVTQCVSFVTRRVSFVTQRVFITSNYWCPVKVLIAISFEGVFTKQPKKSLNDQQFRGLRISI